MVAATRARRSRAAGRPSARSSAVSRSTRSKRSALSPSTVASAIGRSPLSWSNTAARMWSRPPLSTTLPNTARPAPSRAAASRACAGVRSGALRFATDSRSTCGSTPRIPPAPSRLLVSRSTMPLARYCASGPPSTAKGKTATRSGSAGWCGGCLFVNQRAVRAIRSISTRPMTAAFQIRVGTARLRGADSGFSSDRVAASLSPAGEGWRSSAARAATD